MIEHFSAQELECKATGKVRLASGFAEKLVQLREAFGQPMHVTSCCRSREYNTRLGGHPRSLHIYDDPPRNIDGTCAIDVRTFNTGELVCKAWEMGWSVGIGRAFVHLDRRDFVGLQQHMFGYK